MEITREQLLNNYRKSIEEYCNSPYRRNREYGNYLKRWFEYDGICDGQTLQERSDPNGNSSPMPYNIYFS